MKDAWNCTRAGRGCHVAWADKGYSGVAAKAACTSAPMTCANGPGSAAWRTVWASVASRHDAWRCRGVRA
jgi:hypothetical protein